MPSFPRQSNSNLKVNFFWPPFLMLSDGLFQHRSCVYFRKKHNSFLVVSIYLNAGWWVFSRPFEMRPLVKVYSFQKSHYADIHLSLQVKQAEIGGSRELGEEIHTRIYSTHHSKERSVDKEGHLWKCCVLTKFLETVFPSHWAVNKTFFFLLLSLCLALAPFRTGNPRWNFDCPQTVVSLLIQVWIHREQIAHTTIFIESFYLNLISHSEAPQICFSQLAHSVFQRFFSQNLVVCNPRNFAETGNTVSTVQ